MSTSAPFVRPDPESHVDSFTRRSTPGPTFPLVLAAVAVAVLSLHADGVRTYSEPVTWVLGGIVLGGVPALIVSAFLVLAVRAIRRLVGHDAPEAFSVTFIGVSGLVSATGLLYVARDEALPLVLVTGASFVSVLGALVVDDARLRLLRQAFSGAGGAFEIAPAERFAADPTLAPIVAQAGADRVLLRVDRRLGSYRAAAARPVALLAETEEATMRPLERRRLEAASMLAIITLASALAALTYGALA